MLLSYVVPGIVAALISAFVVILFAGLWVALPLARRQRPQASQDVEGNDRHERLPAPESLVARVGDDGGDRRIQPDADRDNDGCGY